MGVGAIRYLGALSERESELEKVARYMGAVSLRQEGVAHKLKEPSHCFKILGKLVYLQTGHFICSHPSPCTLPGLVQMLLPHLTLLLTPSLKCHRTLEPL